MLPFVPAVQADNFKRRREFLKHWWKEDVSFVPVATGKMILVQKNARHVLKDGRKSSREETRAIDARSGNFKITGRWRRVLIAKRESTRPRQPQFLANYVRWAGIRTKSNKLIATNALLVGLQI